jgi:hypothetical protein
MNISLVQLQSRRIRVKWKYKEQLTKEKWSRKQLNNSSNNSPTCKTHSSQHNRNEISHFNEKLILKIAWSFGRNFRNRSRKAPPLEDYFKAIKTCEKPQ